MEYLITHDMEAWRFPYLKHEGTEPELKPTSHCGVDPGLYVGLRLIGM